MRATRAGVATYVVVGATALIKMKRFRDEVPHVQDPTYTSPLESEVISSEDEDAFERPAVHRPNATPQPKCDSADHANRFECRGTQSAYRKRPAAVESLDAGSAVKPGLKRASKSNTAKGYWEVPGEIELCFCALRYF